MGAGRAGLALRAVAPGGTAEFTRLAADASGEGYVSTTLTRIR